MKVFSEEDILKLFVKQAAKSGISSEDKLHTLKKKFAKEYKTSLFTNFQLQKAYEELLAEGWEGDTELQKIMRKRKVRTLSGVSVITVLMKAYPCPGKCVFCPSEPGMPKSYLSNEPGAMRAVLDDFDPAAQVKTRLASLKRQGHETSKIEMIVLGGTFASYPKDYQEEFIKALYDTCNGEKSETLEEAQILNESANNKIIGLSLETRPDSITEEELKSFRRYGCTKLQIGVQHTDNEILKYNKRGETIEDTIKAFKLIKDSGFKIATHLMPNLPGSTPEKDLEMLQGYFENPNFKPDHLKLYPCVVTPYSELETWWEEGKYKAYSDEVLMDLLLAMKKEIPRYVRLERLLRDIPGETILEGSQKTNMRQLLHDKMKKNNIKCDCIRCREIKGESYDANSTKLDILEYESSDGKEYFISFNDTARDKICSLLRLRIPGRTFIDELEGASIVREVHTYGQQLKVGGNKTQESQHAGLGRRMLEEAERITKENNLNKIAVIAGVGTRNYYRKWAYKLEGTYMIKEL